MRAQTKPHHALRAATSRRAVDLFERPANTHAGMGDRRAPQEKRAFLEQHREGDFVDLHGEARFREADDATLGLDRPTVEVAVHQLRTRDERGEKKPRRHRAFAFLNFSVNTHPVGALSPTVKSPPITRAASRDVQSPTPKPPFPLCRALFKRT